jgi:hypothetical protein
MRTPQGIHYHPLQAAALSPKEILVECQSLVNWVGQKESPAKSAKLKEAIESKDAPTAWELVKDLHLRFVGQDEKTQDCLLAWSLLERLQKAHNKWMRCGFPYTEILQPPPKDLDSAESRCREALILTISFQPFLRPKAGQTLENETARHCLAYTLLSCLHHDSPSLEGDIKRLKEMVYANQPMPRPRETPKERLNILTQTMLLVAYGGPISEKEWSRPDYQSVSSLLTYIYDSSNGKVSHLIPQETRDLKDALDQLHLL